mmetsp:Transcript_24635/g.51157  ORF Transcript_24635/g.51157 Transcript_24635/m.51157 type:complete len:81 (+) Transcript_24635:343-585(+)
MGRSSQISGTALCTHISSLEKKCQPISYLGFKWFQRKKLPNQKGILDGLLSKFSDLLELAQKVGHSPLHILDAALSISIV